MSDWKRRERQVAEALGGKRTGPQGKHMTDVQHPLLAVEVKSRRQLPAWAEECLEQARTAVDCGNRVPTVVMVGHGQRIGDALVVMRLRDFEQLYGRFNVEGE